MKDFILDSIASIELNLIMHTNYFRQCLQLSNKHFFKEDSVQEQKYPLNIILWEEVLTKTLATVVVTAEVIKPQLVKVEVVVVIAEDFLAR